MKTRGETVGFCFAALSTVLLPPATIAGGWWLEGGPVYRGGMTVEVTGSSYAELLGPRMAEGPAEHPTTLGEPGAYGDRVYDDGYVKLDAGTLNPNSVGGLGNTYNWAYDRTDQFDGSDLKFGWQGARGWETMSTGPGRAEDEVGGVGLQLQAGLPLLKSGAFRLDLSFSFQGTWGAKSDLDATWYQEGDMQYSVTDTYGVADVIDPESGFPQPRTAEGGYVGSYDVPGPTMRNRPDHRESLREIFGVAQSEVSLQTRLDTYELALSPRLHYQASRALALNLTPKIGLAILDIGVDRSEVYALDEMVLGRWSDSDSETALRFTLGVTAGADVDLGKGFYAGVFGGYAWVVEDVELDVGPNTVTVDGSGYVAGVVVGVRF